MPTQKPYEVLITSMKELRLSEKHSDFVIKCHHDTYKVHKAIICPRCDFFDRATQFGKEAEDGEVDLVNDEPEIVKLMIQYLYELDYTLVGEVDPRPLTVRFEAGPSHYNANMEWRRSLAIGLAGLNKESMGEAVKIVQKHFPELELTGDTYIIRWKDDDAGKAYDTEIRELIGRNGSSNGVSWQPKVLQDAPVTHARMYAIADKYNVLGLKELAIDKFIAASKDQFTNSGFYDAVDLVYTSTSDNDLALRDVVADSICDDIEVYGLDSRAEEKMKMVPDLALRVIKRHFGQKGCGLEGRF